MSDNGDKTSKADGDGSGDGDGDGELQRALDEAQQLMNELDTNTTDNLGIDNHGKDAQADEDAFAIDSDDEETDITSANTSPTKVKTIDCEDHPLSDGFWNTTTVPTAPSLPTTADVALDVLPQSTSPPSTQPLTGPASLSDAWRSQTSRFASSMAAMAQRAATQVASAATGTPQQLSNTVVQGQVLQNNTVLPAAKMSGPVEVVLDNEQKAALIQSHVGDLLPGERVIMFLSNLLHVSDGAFQYNSTGSTAISTSTAQGGSAMWCCAMTFYRLIFFSTNKASPSSTSPQSPPGWHPSCWPSSHDYERLIEMPLACIDKVEKTVFVANVPSGTNVHNNVNTSLTSLMGLLLQAKDGRQIRFTTTSYADTVRAHQALQTYAFPGRRNLGYLFAFESKRQQVMASIVVDAAGHKTVTFPPTRKRYDALQEFTRQSQTTANSQHQPWALWTQVNQGYQTCASYPNMIAGPASISERTVEGQRIIRQCASFRSENRLPALTWSSYDGASLWRASQPKIGLQGNRSFADELFLKHVAEQAASANALIYNNTTTTITNTPINNHAAAATFQRPCLSRSMIMKLTGSDISSVVNWLLPTQSAAFDTNPSMSQQQLQKQSSNVSISTSTSAIGLKIMDLRPRSAAMANRTGGYGYENTSNYPNTTLQFCNIGNIHAVRDAYQKLSALCLSGGFTSAMPSGSSASSSSTTCNASPQDLQWNALIEDTKWLSQIRLILAAAWETAFWIHVHRLPVLLHCSHGWDRTSQVAVLAQLLLDPFYRTRQGFAVLVEKDFMSFGHPFHTRCAHGEGKGMNNNVSNSNNNSSSGESVANSMANAVGGVMVNVVSGVAGTAVSSSVDEGQISPIFLQFLDCVYQIVSLYPDCFEFTTQYLLEISDHVHSCRFGNFLCDTERERELVAGIRQRTHSLWDYLDEQYDKDSPLFNYDFVDAGGVLLMPLPTLLRNVSLWTERHCRYSPKPMLLQRRQSTKMKVDTVSNDSSAKEVGTALENRASEGK